MGDYVIDMWGKPSEQPKIHRKNGYLYVDTIRLIVEHEPGLFFHVRWRGRRFQTC